MATEELLATTFGFLADRVATRARAKGVAGRTVTRSATLPRPVSSTRTLTEVAVDLTDAALADHRWEREVSLLALSLSNLVSQADVQLELPLGLDGGGVPDEFRELAEHDDDPGQGR